MMKVYENRKRNIYTMQTTKTALYTKRAAI